MPKKFNIIFFAIALSLAAEVPAYAGETASNLNNFIDSLSNLLSSTNPKTANYKDIEPNAGEMVETPQPDTRTRIANLPPLTPIRIHAGYSLENTEAPAPSPIVSVPVPAPQAEMIKAPEADYVKLSAETKRILEATPSKIGSAKQQKHERITMKRGEFDPEYGSIIDEPIDKGEDGDKIRKIGDKGTAPMPVLAKAKYEIKVQTAKSGESQVNTLDKALRALNAGQYEVAVSLYKTAAQKDSHDRDAMFGLATSYQKAGQKIQARDAYAKLLAQYPTYQPGLSNLLVLASSEAPKDALKELDQIGARNPNFAPVYAQKGSIYMQAGDEANAKANFIKALNIEPTNITYRYNLAILLDKSGDNANAVKLYSEILDQNAQGAKLPVERSQIEERLAFIGSQRESRS